MAASILADCKKSLLVRGNIFIFFRFCFINDCAQHIQYCVCIFVFTTKIQTENLMEKGDK